MPTPLLATQLQFSVPFTRYQGKVRDVYRVMENFLVLVATDRLSAFDYQMRQAIPYKGQVLNQLAVYFLENTEDICPNHLLAIPHPQAVVGLACEAYPVEVIVRGYLAGSAWRAYRDGARVICGVRFPDGLRENDPLPEPVLTPTTKSKVGHDIEVSELEIVKSGMVSAEDWERIRFYALKLYERGAAHARQQGLILADTKYEFGWRDFDIFLIDELHTPDSSRYWYAGGYEDRQSRGEPQEQLSKEYVRQWLISKNFMGLEGQTLPDLPEAIVHEISQRYIEVYATLTGQRFEPYDHPEPERDLQERTNEALRRLGVFDED